MWAVPIQGPVLSSMAEMPTTEVPAVTDEPFARTHTPDRSSREWVKEEVEKGGPNIKEKIEDVKVLPPTESKETGVGVDPSSDDSDGDGASDEQAFPLLPEQYT